MTLNFQLYVNIIVRIFKFITLSMNPSVLCQGFEALMELVDAINRQNIYQSEYSSNHFNDNLSLTSKDVIIILDF